MEDDFEPEGGQVPQAPEAQAPAIPMPFTQADSLQLQKLQQGASQASQALFDGDIDEHTHQQYQLALQEQIQPLMVRQKEAQARAEQEQKKKAMELNAQQVAVRQQDAAYDAKGFGDRTSTYTDPLTGKAAHFFQHEAGKWSQVDMPEDTEQPNGEAGAETGGETGGQDVALATPAAGEGAQPAEAPLSQEEIDARTKDPVSNDERRKAFEPAPGFAPTEAQRAAQRIHDENAKHGITGDVVPKDLRDKAAADKQAQLEGHARDTSLSKGQLNELMKRAEATIRGPQGPHRDQQVHELFQHLVTAHQREAQHRDDRQSMAAEHREQEKARQEAAKQKESDKKDKEEKAKADKYESLRHKDYDTELSDLRRQKAHHEKEATDPKDIPDYLKDDDKMAAKAVENMERKHKALGVEKPGSAKKETAKEEPKGPEPKPEAKPADPKKQKAAATLDSLFGKAGAPTPLTQAPNLQGGAAGVEGAGNLAKEAVTNPHWENVAAIPGNIVENVGTNLGNLSSRERFAKTRLGMGLAGLRRRLGLGD